MNGHESRWVTLGEVAKRVSYRHSPSAEMVERWIGADHLDEGDLTVRRWSATDDPQFPPTFKFRFDAGAVLIHSRNPKKVALADFQAITGEKLFALRTRDPLVLAQRFLAYQLRSESFGEFVSQWLSGSVNKFLNWSSLERYNFLLPPLEMQLQLVAVGDAFEETRAELARAEDACFVTLRSNLRSLLTALADIEPRPCSEWADVRVGKKLSPAQRQNVRPRPYLRAVNLRGTYIDTTDVNRMDFTPDEDEILSIRKGDVLLVEGGNRDSVGAPTLVRSTPKPKLYIQNTIVRLRVKDDSSLDPHFLYWLWRAMHEARAFEAIAVGTKLYHLGPNRVSAHEIRIPAVDLQIMWVQRLDAAARLLDRVEVHREQSRVLQQSVLGSLLSGGARV